MAYELTRPAHAPLTRHAKQVRGPVESKEEDEMDVDDEGAEEGAEDEAGEEEQEAGEERDTANLTQTLADLGLETDDAQRPPLTMEELHGVCVCVCVRVRARARVCVSICVGV